MVAAAKLNGARKGNRQSGSAEHLVNDLSDQPNGRGLPKIETEVSADVVQLALRSRFNPIRGLTPQSLSSQLDQFYLGFIAFAALTWDAIERRDDVLKGIAGKRKKDVSRLDWEVLTVDGADDTEAKAHKEALEEFYNNVEAVNALDQNERGGFPLLVRQMMDAVGKYYAVHEIVWKPGNVLTAELRFVPLWFFENRTGNLRFMRIPLGGSEGDPLEAGGWMITKGDGLMEACSVAYMFKNMPLKDWVAYSDKFGTPGVLGETNAAKGSDAGLALRDAVRNFGQNWSATIYGSDGAIKEPIKLIQAKGEGVLPFPPLIERMDRAMSALWRGSDLSTMSGHGSGANTGASVQGEESNILLVDDAAMVSETLNYYIDRHVLWQKFGVGFDSGKPALAYIKVVAPEDEDLKLAITIDEFLLNSGARIGENDRLEYYGRSRCSDDDTPLHAPAKITERLTPKDATGKIASGVETLSNQQRDVASGFFEKLKSFFSNESRSQKSEVRRQKDNKDLERYLGPHKDAFLKAFANDLQPLRSAIEIAIANGSETEQRSQLLTLHARLPQVLGQINESDKSAIALAKIIATEFSKGFSHR